MITTEQATLYRSLFILRSDAFGLHANGQWIKQHKYFTDAPLMAHFNGSKRLGAYTTLPGENSCQWVVADFDKNEEALQHSISLRNKLREYKIESFIERSFSGQGYHVWVFFSEPIQAVHARQMMLGALTLAGVPIHGEMKKGGNTERSFDRLFPSQDTVVVGKFGNLIGLPLCGEAVSVGNTCFIDDNQRPLNQWDLLQEIHLNHRVQPDHPAIETLAEYVPQTAASKVQIQPMNTDDVHQYWSAIADIPGQLNRLQGCTAIQESIRDAEQFQEPQWQDVLSNIAVHTLGKQATEAQKLAHAVSEGYSTYTPEDTDEKLAYKQNNLQKGGWPTSCKTLMANGGWTCPRLIDKSCQYGFIAKYGIEPSFTIYHEDKPLGVAERVLLNQYEQRGLYSVYRSLFAKETTGTLSDYNILAHLLGYKQMKINCTGPVIKSFIYNMPTEHAALQLERFLNNNQVSCFRKNKRIWIIRKNESSLASTGKAFCRLLQEAQVQIVFEPLDIHYSKQKNSFIAPFFGELPQLLKYAQMEDTTQ